MVRITSEQELPDWYDVSKYHGCESFGAAEWYACLLIRKDILQFAKWLDNSGLSPLNFSEFLNKKEQCAHELDRLREAPLDWESGKGWFWHSENCRVRASDMPVRDLLLDDIAFQLSYDRENKKEAGFQAERWQKVINDDGDSDLFIPIGNIEDTGEPILVDLRANDSVLITSFTAWLRAARQKQSDKISRERPAYKSWASYGLLPYLDLKIWSYETKIHIPHEVIAREVKYCKGGDSFRKTVPKLASLLMHSLDELKALAASEIYPEKL